MTIHPETLDPADPVMFAWKTREGVMFQLFPRSEVTGECVGCGGPLVEPPSELLALKKDEPRCLKCGGP